MANTKQERKPKPRHCGKVTHVRADGTIEDSMERVEIPPDNGYYVVLKRIAERLMREREKQDTDK